MYASQKNVQILVALLKEHGVRHAVISPGSRNMALVRSLENDPFFTCYSVVDERSAAYFAIGVSLANDEAPVLLSCTSAQATRNYLPGLTEAYYRGTPIVAITADYRESHIGQGLMQTVDQMSMPKDTHKASVRLPVVSDEDDAWYCERLVNEALLELHHHGTGPVHIDLPIDEHWEGYVESLPSVKRIDRYTMQTPDLPPLGASKILVVVGEHAPFSAQQAQALEAFVEATGAVVYTTHLSNYHGAGSVNGSLVVLNLKGKGADAYTPELLITVGGQHGDYDIASVLNAMKPRHWRVSLDGRIQDTYGSLEAVFEMSEADFFSAYASRQVAEPSREFQATWEKANAERAIPDGLPLSHAFVAGVLAPQIPHGSSIHFAILSAYRNWSFFHLHPSIAGYSNVAAYGIDGCVSTFIGHSVATEELTFLVVGDLSFFYDMNSIGIRHVKNNARIILVNNNGGGEFRLYSHAADRYFGEDADTHIAAAGHHGMAQAWAESMGWLYRAVRTKQDLVDVADAFVSPSDKPFIIEVFTTMHDDSEGVRIIREANTHESLARRLAKRLPPSVADAVPPRVKELAKRVIKR
ncbi:2-succinyl-5-enolpyruvyl-6-hydroxy-3-cyclohexene-1-carboxylate synthase [Protaetiibacter sp. SSC-01]|uniref:2-succinyl-5-enolpyruvyl-6-hydroxy-3- cyclohexene-1-carboxylate synthase n=1 Tax=Protaetiibacter sp. SSC-01 TaxID=2759943 RepID=UPI001656C04D|nr:thiamine pyrophosphate-binding protein [Protaetiibacter sp. SSC-01]QNO38091.1 2-succinyl-5-enolpyruvyl-6-hydroxy-3-cyclohexene-1-carboxylate synthase [Protaetiibacter sp. SSC-01]